MTAILSEAEHKFDAPSSYRIVVAGALARDWSDRLGGLSIRHETDQGGVCTILIGRLTDQAALAGVLRSLYELHLPLIMVEQLPSPEPPPADSSG